MILILLYITFALITVLAIRARRVVQLNAVFFCGTLCFILTGIRWKYGGDWDSYFDYFRSIRGLTFEEGFEPGWNVVSYIIKTTFNSYTVFQFTMAGILFYTSFTVIKKLSVVPILSFLLYYSMTDAGLPYVRKGIAAGILLLSLLFIVNRDLKKFLLCVGCASLIHYSAVVSLPIYWIYHNKSSYKKYFVIFVCSTAVFYVFGKLIFSNVSFLGDYLNYKLTNYMEQSEAGENFGVSISPERAMINQLLKKFYVFFFIFCYCKEVLTRDIRFRGFLNIYVFSLIFYCSVVPLAFQFARMSAYFEIVEMLIYAYIYYYLPQKEKSLFLLLALLFNAWRIFGHADPGQPDIYNYHTVFELF